MSILRAIVKTNRSALPPHHECSIELLQQDRRGSITLAIAVNVRKPVIVTLNHRVHLQLGTLSLEIPTSLAVQLEVGLRALSEQSAAGRMV